MWDMWPMSPPSPISVSVKASSLCTAPGCTVCWSLPSRLCCAFTVNWGFPGRNLRTGDPDHFLSPNSPSSRQVDDSMSEQFLMWWERKGTGRDGNEQRRGLLSWKPVDFSKWQRVSVALWKRKLGTLMPALGKAIAPDKKCVWGLEAGQLWFLARGPSSCVSKPRFPSSPVQWT